MLPEKVTRSLAKGMSGFTNFFERTGCLPPDLRHSAEEAATICLEICKEEGLISETLPVTVLEGKGTLSLKLGEEVLVLSGELDYKDKLVTV